MTWSTLELAMKAATFLGVATASTLLAMQHRSRVLDALHAAVGAAGVALMIANARLAASTLGILVDVGYLAGCLALLGNAVRLSKKNEGGARERAPTREAARRPHP